MWFFCLFVTIILYFSSFFIENVLRTFIALIGFRIVGVFMKKFD